MKDRSFNSMRNSTFALLDQGFEAIVSFIVRTVFIYSLGETYLGLNGLFNDILTMLSLTELGFGTAIMYSMYKPMTENNEKKVAALLQLYKKIYWAVGVIVAVVGLVITPFLDFFISDMPDIPELILIYWLYLANTAVSYFFSYKRSILIADQVVYITSVAQIITKFLQYILQIIILLVFHQMVLYLVIQVCCTFLNNFAISLYVDKNYKYLRKYKNEKLDLDTTNQIKTNVAAMFASKISSVIVTSTDNILISKFISVVTLGYYSNYTLFVNLIKTTFTKIFEAITGSVGNLLALDNSGKAKSTFNDIFFVNFWLDGFSSVCLFVLINPFISLWIGESFQLSIPVVFMICLNMYMRLIRCTQLIFIDTYGLFTNVRMKCIAEAIINLTVSLILLVPLDMGIYGVLLGTFISNIATSFWFEPHVIFRSRFVCSPAEYFKKFFLYFFVTILTGTVLHLFTVFVKCGNKIVDFIIYMVVCVVGINLIYYLLFSRTEEFVFLKEKMKNIIRRVMKKIR